MAGQVAQGDLLTTEGPGPGCGRQIAGQRIVQADDAMLGQVGQQQPGEHLGDRPDLEDRGAIGRIGRVAAKATIPGDALPRPPPGTRSPGRCAARTAWPARPEGPPRPARPDPVIVWLLAYPALPPEGSAAPWPLPRRADRSARALDKHPPGERSSAPAPG